MADSKPEVDVSKLSEEERKHYEKYGKLKKNPFRQHKQKKFFDSADWQMSGGGAGAGNPVKARAPGLLGKKPLPKDVGKPNTTPVVAKDDE